MIRKLKSAGSTVLGFAVMFLFLLLPFVILKGAATVGARAYPFISTVAVLVTLIGIPVLLLLAALPPTRGVAGHGFVITSYIYGLALWLWSFFYVLSVWGWFAVIVGLFMAGVGVVPIAMLASAIHGEWSIPLQLVIGIVMTFGCRLVGVWFIANAADRRTRISEPAI